jgi:hypothetical protein
MLSFTYGLSVSANHVRQRALDVAIAEINKTTDLNYAHSILLRKQGSPSDNPRPSTFVYDGAGIAANFGRWPGGRERTVPIRFSEECFEVGEDTGTPVNLNYDVPFKFTGKIEKGDG